MYVTKTEYQHKEIHRGGIGINILPNVADTVGLVFPQITGNNTKL